MDDPEDEEAGADKNQGSQRIDRWLWFARVTKTRTLAARLVAEGRVRINRQRIDKPAQRIKPADVVAVATQRSVRILKVVALGARRGPPAEAARLFEDLTPADTAPAEAATKAGRVAPREPGAGRPTKRDRRLIERLQGDSD